MTPRVRPPPRHLFAAIRLCRLLTGQNLVPQHFSISHHRSEGTSEMTRFVGMEVEFGAARDEFALNLDARELPLIHFDPYLNDLLLKYCEAALAYRRGDLSQLRTKVERDFVAASTWKSDRGGRCSQSGSERKDASTKACGRRVELH
jgi:hypothetical protein